MTNGTRKARSGRQSTSKREKRDLSIDRSNGKTSRSMPKKDMRKDRRNGMTSRSRLFQSLRKSSTKFLKMSVNLSMLFQPSSRNITASLKILPKNL